MTTSDASKTKSERQKYLKLALVQFYCSYACGLTAISVHNDDFQLFRNSRGKKILTVQGCPVSSAASTRLYNSSADVHQFM